LIEKADRSARLYASVSGGLCDDSVVSKSGYYKVEGSKDLNYFYWFFESRSDPANDPVIIWLTGKRLTYPDLQE
jgi:carboxypeptidase C (cathepsin A)